MMNDYLTIVNEEVIKCDTDATDVVIPDGVISIRQYAFAYCKSIESITIPDSVTSLENSVFYRCANVMIQCNRNSYAEEYAKKNNIPYKIID